MKALVLLLGFGLAAFSQDAKPKETWTQEPDSFMGIQFNSTRESAVAARKVQPALCALASARIGGMVCRGAPLTIGTTSIPMTLTFQDDKFVRASASLPSSGYEDVRDVFIDKYGKPDSDVPDVLQNRAGVKFENHILEWTGKAVHILLAKYADTVTNGVMVVELISAKDADAKAREDAKKKAAQSF